VSSYTNDIYGLVIMMVFFVLLTLGFIFELGKNALTIDSRQTSSYSNGDTATPHIFLTVPYELLKRSCVLKSGVSFCTDNGKSNGDITFYIPLYRGDNMIFVPVVSVDTMTFKADLTEPIYKGNPIPNNEEDSNKAIEKAISIFKQSELCVCDLKQVS